METASLHRTIVAVVRIVAIYRAYRVCITYREPTFEQHMDRGPRTYRAVFVVFARAPAGAEVRARGAFESLALNSRVSWVREITAVDVREAPHGAVEQLDGAAA